jgi:hypothetical protein
LEVVVIPAILVLLELLILEVEVEVDSFQVLTVAQELLSYAILLLSP